MEPIVVGISGASGIILAKKTIQALVTFGCHIDLVITGTALVTAKQELGTSSSKELIQEFGTSVTLYQIYDFMAAIASGSYKTAGMVIVPCSMSTLAAVALGLSDNLLRRAADVCIKEKRPLVIVPRETPLSVIHLKHMLSLAEMGAHIVAPIPAWYNKPQSLDEAEDFIVGKVLDCLKVPHQLSPEWPH